MEKEKIIDVKDLKIQFGETLILKNINFSVYKGEIFAIIGGSGCGKTVLLKHLIGLLDAYTGEIMIENTNLRKIKEYDYNNFLNKIGVAFQYGALLGSMTLEENITLPIIEHRKVNEEIARNIAKWKLSLVDLKGYEKYYPSDISGGMRKRASIARAIALNPEVLFLDEPTSGLDPVTSSEIDNLIERLNKAFNTTMILITHDIDTVFNITDRIILLDKIDKTIIAEGNPIDVYNTNKTERVIKFFERKRTSLNGV
jgi:phospholipid/cholesterol/gamma-HCH transport system ATP-binding protein